MKIAITNGGGLEVESSDPRRKVYRKGLQTACILPHPKIMFSTHKLSTAIRREVQEFKQINKNLSAFTTAELNYKVISEDKHDHSSKRKLSEAKLKDKFNRKSLQQFCESHSKRKSSLQTTKDQFKTKDEKEEYIRITSRVDWDAAEYLRDNQK